LTENQHLPVKIQGYVGKTPEQVASVKPSFLKINLQIEHVKYFLPKANSETTQVRYFGLRITLVK